MLGQRGRKQHPPPTALRDARSGGSWKAFRPSPSPGGVLVYTRGLMYIAHWPIDWVGPAGRRVKQSGVWTAWAGFGSNQLRA